MILQTRKFYKFKKTRMEDIAITGRKYYTEFPQKYLTLC